MDIPQQFLYIYPENASYWATVLSCVLALPTLTGSISTTCTSHLPHTTASRDKECIETSIKKENSRLVDPGIDCHNDVRPRYPVLNVNPDELPLPSHRFSNVQRCTTDIQKVSLEPTNFIRLPRSTRQRFAFRAFRKARNSRCDRGNLQDLPNEVPKHR